MIYMQSRLRKYVDEQEILALSVNNEFIIECLEKYHEIHS